jgi:hypothetical protein
MSGRVYILSPTELYQYIQMMVNNDDSINGKYFNGWVSQKVIDISTT